ncbi:MAG: peptidoglycan-binding protein, partial [Candidatus Saccharibacteria bacterium]|nr:peptidoglycan-binding protein [Pseudorhodobacter sp.]
MTFARDRRRVLRLMTSALAATAVMGSQGAFAASLVSAFAQAVSAAAQDDEAVAAFYQGRNYATLWTGPADVARRQALFDLLDTATAHALPSRRYDAAGLRSKFAAAVTEGDVGRLEVDMTRAYLAIVRDLTSGAVVPAKVISGVKREIDHLDPVTSLAAAESDQFDRFIGNLSPVAPEYARLMKEKFALEEVMAAGGYGPVVTADGLAPGDTGPDVVQLRDRLVAVGYLGRSFTQTYDQTITESVQRFQIDNGLVADGAADTRTIAALNIEADQRWRSVVVAMERLRWMRHAPL